MSDEYDTVARPEHYVSHPSGIECITIARHMNFNIGNAIKYLWRYTLKGGTEDLKKAIFYIADEIVLNDDPSDDEEVVEVRRRIVAEEALGRNHNKIDNKTDDDYEDRLSVSY